jgi:hypothetical protein
VLAAVGGIDFRQVNLRTGFDHEILPIVHADFLPLQCRMQP